MTLGLTLDLAGDEDLEIYYSGAMTSENVRSGEHLQGMGK